MIIERKIGRVSVDIDIKEANEVYVESDYVGLIKEEGISGILNALYDANGIEHMPLSLFMELTSRCNFSCPFCYINEEQTEYTENPSFPELQKILDYFIEKGLLHCVLSGGECLLHPDFPKIYKYLKEAGVLVTVFSNGYLFNEEIFSLFERYKPFKVEISIYGSDDLTYNVTTNRKNIKAKKVFDNIIRLKEMGINIVCKTPITSFTEKSYPIIEKWCFENDIPYYTGIELMDTYTGNSRKEYLSSEKIRKELREKSDKEFFENKEMMEIGYSKKEKKMQF